MTRQKRHSRGEGGRSREPLSGPTQPRETAATRSRAAHPSGNAGGSVIDRAILLPGEAWLPRDYVPDFRAKIDVYRRLSRATAAGQVDDLAAELTDRFGPPPD